MTGVGIFCLVCAVLALWASWWLRELMICVLGTVLASAYLAVGIWAVLT